MAPTRSELSCGPCDKVTEHFLVEEQQTGGGSDYLAMYECSVCGTNQPG